MAELVDVETGLAPSEAQVNQLIAAEKGYRGHGVRRAWRIPVPPAESGPLPPASTVDPVVLELDESGIRLSDDGGVTAPSPPIVVGTAAGGALGGTYPNPILTGSTVDGMLPPGVIWAYGGTVAPGGWLLCDGAAVGRTTYAKLFAVIGGTYGAGDGSTTFNVPDLRGRVVLGASGTHPLGTVGGSEAGPAHTHPGVHGHGMTAHTHVVAHFHNMNGHTHMGTSHTHSGTALGITGVTGPPSAVATRLDGPNPVGAEVHTHDGGTLDVTGTTDAGGVVATGAPSTPDTSGSSAPTSGSPSTPATENDATAHAASYPASVVLPPFGTANYIIRTGA